MKRDMSFKYVSLGLTWSWLIIFACIPIGLVLISSFLSFDETHLVKLPFTLNHYLELIDPLYLKIFERSFYLAGLCTLICLLIGYPFAFFIARLKNGYKGLALLLVIIPFWTSSLIRTYSMMTILKPKGLLTAVLMSLHLIQHPLQILYTNTAAMIGLVYNLLPFMVLPLLTSIETLDDQLIDAARDLGANRFTCFRKIIIPLTMPGILAGSILVFLPAMTLFYIPDILGGAKSILLGNLIQSQFLITQNWPSGSAISLVLILLLGLLLWVYWRRPRHQKNREWL